MAVYPRPTVEIKPFASDAIASERTVFGSTEQSDDIDDNLIAALFRGWGIVGPNDLPTKQDFNGATYTLSYLIAYLMQQGITEWVEGQEYREHSIVKVGDQLYTSLQDNNINHPPDEGAPWWAKYIDFEKTPSGYLNGLRITNAPGDLEHDVTMAPGSARSDDDAATLILSAAITKQFDTVFAEGNNAGGFASGEALPTSGSINIWLIGKDDGTVDVMANDHDESGYDPALPEGFTTKRRVASLCTDGSNNIRGFVQHGNYFYTKNIPLDFNITSISTTRTPYVVTAPANMLAMIFGTLGGASQTRVLLTGAGIDESPATSLLNTWRVGTGTASSSINNGHAIVLLNNERQMFIQREGDNIANQLTGGVYGWIDERIL